MSGDFKILIADDDSVTVRMIESALKEFGHEVMCITDGLEAYEFLQKGEAPLAILDWMMPGMSGVEICKRIREDARLNSMYIILLTIRDSREDVIEGFQSGADDYITKPFNSEELKARAQVGVRVAELQYSLETRVKELEELVSLRQRMKKLRKTMDGVIKVISLIGEIIDPYTAGHQRRVADLAGAIAREMGLSKNRVDCIFIAGTVHDIGKIAVPKQILSNPGKLNDIEFQIIKTHPEVAYDILKTVDFDFPLAKIVLQHHEKMDGSGYPHGVTADEILLESKVLSVADVVEAVASHRPYRAALGVDKALSIINAGKGAHFYEDAVNACIRLFENGYTLDEKKPA